MKIRIMEVNFLESRNVGFSIYDPQLNTKYRSEAGAEARLGLNRRHLLQSWVNPFREGRLV